MYGFSKAATTCTGQQRGIYRCPDRYNGLLVGFANVLSCIHVFTVLSSSFLSGWHSNTLRRQPYAAWDCTSAEGAWRWVSCLYRTHSCCVHVQQLSFVVCIAVLDEFKSVSKFKYVCTICCAVRFSGKPGGCVIVHFRQSRCGLVRSLTLLCERNFCPLTCFRIFNTNNLWCNLKAVKDRLISGTLDMEIIVNHKVCCALYITCPMRMHAYQAYMCAQEPCVCCTVMCTGTSCSSLTAVCGVSPQDAQYFDWFRTQPCLWSW